jgi:hypothetical protein
VPDQDGAAARDREAHLIEYQPERYLNALNDI